MHTRRFAARRGLLGGLVAFVLFAASTIGMATDGSINGAGGPAPALTAQTTFRPKATLVTVERTVDDTYGLSHDRPHR